MHWAGPTRDEHDAHGIGDEELESDLDAPVDAGIEVRVSADGRTWSDWYAVLEDHDMAEGDTGERYAQPLPVAPSRFAQYRVRADAEVASVALTFMDTSDLNAEPDPVARLAGDLASAWRRITTPLVASAAPSAAVRTREQWGADRSLLRSPPWHVPWKKAIVHHTVTTNSYAEATAQIRAVYYFHSVTRRWGDIGYNFLVDKWGKVWQGRAGGDDSVGMHASGWNEGTFGVATLGVFSSATPSATMRDAVARVIAAKLGARGIQPMGADRFTHEEIDRYRRWHDVTGSPPNVIGHRDAIDVVGARGAGTACPGNRLYSYLESIRRTAQGLVAASPGTAPVALPAPTPAAPAQLGVKWVARSVPSRIHASALSVPVTIRNTGSLPWLKGLVNVGYHWYDDEGRVAVWEGERTPLLADVEPGNETKLKVRVLPPAGEGRFRLVLDLVWEGRSWFSKLGASTVSRRVTAGSTWQATYSLPASSPVVGEPGARLIVPVTLTNSSSFAWSPGDVSLAYHVHDIRGGLVRWDGARTKLPAQVAPGATVTIDAVLELPDLPGGYVVRWDLVFEGVAWFSDRGVPAEALGAVVSAK